MQANEIRQAFLDYFKAREHQAISSSSLIPDNDPTLLFTNAGMNQFKDYFTGKVRPQQKKAVTVQKCVRAGGKHNDLENVGFTPRHHTFFEMLGNFSFGDYFKEEAISMAWDFLTKVMKLPEDKLYVTVHESDQEARSIWHKKIGLSHHRIFDKGDKDNFWEMGEYGPCGPCSEIFYDHGPKYSTPGFDPSKAKDILEDELRYVEIWNLVFMQYEKTKEGTTSLPNPSIDTGCGLERLCAAKQGVYNNYDTDCFTPIIKKIESLTHQSYSDKRLTPSFRVIADHIRAASFLMTDGVLPSNEGRGYVLRRIIRRAVRHVHELNYKEPLLYQLVDTVFEGFGNIYPENISSLELATKLLRTEEEKFNETLEQGLKFLNEHSGSLKSGQIFDGSMAFKLYDTYGFPLDLTEVILRERGIEVDLKAFNQSMDAQKNRSRKSWKGKEFAGQDQNLVKIKEKFGGTNFLGYSTLESSATLLAIETTPQATYLIFDQTPFYAEGGGQIGDQGILVKSDGLSIEIQDCQKPIDDLFLHIVENASRLKVGEQYLLKVDKVRREKIKKNHSATHLLQAALINTLGAHVKQAGSSVTDQKLRFDFTHTEALSDGELEKIEALVNDKIQSSLSVQAEVKSKDEAFKSGALSFFGDKYGDQIRVLEMEGFSKEFCGGTHVSNTSEIGLFKIILETSLQSGVRRIEALTSGPAFDWLTSRSKILAELERNFGLKDKAILKKIDQIQEEFKIQQKELEAIKSAKQSQEYAKLFDSPESLEGNIPFLSSKVKSDVDLVGLSDNFCQKHPNGFLLLYAIQENATVKILLRGPKKSKIHCGNILKSNLSLIDGRGGGRPDLAQGSGSKVESIDQFVVQIKNQITKELQ